MRLLCHIGVTWASWFVARIINKYATKKRSTIHEPRTMLVIVSQSWRFHILDNIVSPCIDSSGSLWQDVVMDDCALQPLISQEKIDAKVRELALRLSRDYNGSSPVCIGVLKGAFIFLADLVRNLSIEPVIDFIQVSSYGSSTVSSGSCTILKDITCDIVGRDVVLIEDIVDTGTTVRFLLEHMSAMHPRSIRTCALLEKKRRRSVDLTIDYCGFFIDNVFVVGYGLDRNEQYRFLPGIYILKDRQLCRH